MRETIDFLFNISLREILFLISFSEMTASEKSFRNWFLSA